MTTPHLIGAAEAAARLGIHRSTLTRKVAAGVIRPATKIGDGRTGAYVFDLADIDALADHDDDEQPEQASA